MVEMDEYITAPGSGPAALGVENGESSRLIA